MISSAVSINLYLLMDVDRRNTPIIHILNTSVSVPPMAEPQYGE